MAARVPSRTTGGPDTVVLSSPPGDDFALILRYLLLQGAVGDPDTAKFERIAARAITRGNADGFFRHAAATLATHGYGSNPSGKSVVAEPMMRLNDLNRLFPVRGLIHAPGSELAKRKNRWQTVLLKHLFHLIPAPQLILLV